MENRAGLDAPSLRLLAEDLAPLDQLAPNLASRLMRWLLDGANPGVLPEIAAIKQAAQKLRLCAAPAAPPAPSASPPSRFFQSVQCSSPQFFVRLGRFYDAASRHLRFRGARPFGDPQLDWLQALLIEATQLTLNSRTPTCRPCPALTADLIEAMLEAEGHPRDLLARAAFQPTESAAIGDTPQWEPVWESLPGLGKSAARHPAAVIAALNEPDFRRQLRALKLMQKCRTPLAAFAGKLFELALGRSLRVRTGAEMLLARAQPRAQALLREKAAAGDRSERACAARLLWRFEGENVRPFLAARLRNEPSKLIRRQLRELLAGPVPDCCPEETSNPARLPAQSARSLAAGIPELLAWFPFDRLPPVHWADNGSLVEPQVLHYWLTQCCQRHSAEPTPALRQYAASLNASDRHALGEVVLQAWIRQDTQPDARAPAGTAAGRQPLSVALASQGVLALAAACGAAGVVAPVRQYLEQWYGRRAAQCRALLQMLAWVEDPAAVKLLLSVAGGFRTRSIQEEAIRQADHLAARKACPVAQLYPCPGH